MAWIYKEDWGMWFNPETGESSTSQPAAPPPATTTKTPTTTPPTATSAPGAAPPTAATSTASHNFVPPAGATAPSDFNADAYLKLNPDVLAYYNNQKEVPGVSASAATVWGTPQNFALQHYLTVGKAEGRQYKTASGGGGGASGGGGAGGGGGTSFGGYQGNINDLISGARSNINEMLNAFSNPLREEAYALAKEQISYASRRLTEIQNARKLLNKTGTLSAEETTLFNDMEAAAVTNLKANVRDETQDVWDTALADLVNKGVLQGTVGSMILGEIASEEVKTVAEGVNNIRIAKNTDMLNMIQGNKNLALQYDTLYANEAQNLLGTGQNYANAALQADLNKLGLGVGAELDLTGLGVNSNLTFAGLESAEGIAGQQMELSKILAQMQIDANSSNLALQLASQWNIAQLNAATQLQLGNLSGNFATTASQYGMYGNLGLGFLGIVSKYGGDWWKQFSSWLDE